MVVVELWICDLMHIFLGSLEASRRASGPKYQRSFVRTVPGPSARPGTKPNANHKRMVKPTLVLFATSEEPKAGGGIHGRGMGEACRRPKARAPNLLPGLAGDTAGSEAMKQAKANVRTTHGPKVS